MSLISLPVTNLVQGVSQQPDPLKLPTQAKLLENGYPHVIDGLGKRPGTDFLGLLTEDQVYPNRYVHWIDRSSDERYVVLIDSSGVRVWDLDGTEFTVVSAAEASPGISAGHFHGDYPYLVQVRPTGLPATQALTMNGWTNSSGTVGQTTAGYALTIRNPSGQIGAARWFVSEADATPDVVRTAASADAEDGPVVVSIHYQSPSLTASASDLQYLSVAWVGSANTSIATFEIVGGVPQLQGTSGTQTPDDTGIEVTGDGWYRLWMMVDITGLADVGNTHYASFTLQGQVAPGSYEALVYGAKIEQGVTEPSAYFAESTYRAITIGDYSFVTNRAKPVQIDSDLSPVNSDTEAYIYLKAGRYNGRYTIKVTTTGGTYTWNVRTDPNADGSLSASADTQDISTKGILDVFANGGAVFAGINSVADWTATVEGSTLLIELAGGDTITNVECSDGAGDTELISLWGQVRSFDDLPAVCGHDYIVKVQGDATLDEDDWYVKFEANSGSGFGEGAWVETVAPGIEYAFDQLTMPHRLVRMIDDNEGTITDTPQGIYFEWDIGNWLGRDAGDEDSNPNPSFVSTDEVDRGISDIFFHRGRLGFLSGEHFILSRSGEYEDFWRFSVTIAGDDDPIDMPASRTAHLPLDWAVDFQEQLILASKEEQFALTAAGQALTPATASVDSITKYEITVGPRPVTTGRTLLVPFQAGGYAGIRELVALGDSSRYVFEPITNEVPAYLSGQVEDLAASTVENLMVVSTDVPGTLYAYCWFFTGDQKLQSAWCTFKLDPDFDVLGLRFFDDELYLVGLVDDSLILERMVFGRNVVTGALDYRLHLDNALRESAATVALNGPDTEITLPEPFSPSTDWRVVDLDTETVYTPTVDGTELVIAGEDLTSADLLIGRSFDFRFQPCPAALKERQPEGGRTLVHDGRIVTKHLLLSYARSGDLTVKVTPEGRSETERSIDFGLSDGVQRFGVLGRADTTVVEFFSDSPMPLFLQTLEWVVEYASNTQRYAG